jgi:GNAT superfamily N-acetyltransferase
VTESKSAAADAYFECMTRLAGLSPGGFTRDGGHGARLVFSAIPVSTLNAVHLGPDADTGEAEAFARELSGTGLPWSIVTRGDVSPAIERLAASYGLAQAESRPLMTWHAEPLPAPAGGLPPGATVRTVRGAGAGRYAAALAEGFGMPAELAGRFASPAFLDAPGCAGFLLDLDGEAVATGFNVIAGDYVGMFNGSVPPRHRGNGYYRALVTARLRDAVAAGARRAFTQNTPMSRPLYESLGFRAAQTWTYLSP